MDQQRELFLQRARKVLLVVSVIAALLFGFAGAATFLWKDALLEKGEAAVTQIVIDRTQAYFDEHASSPAVAIFLRLADEETRKMAQGLLSALRADIPKIIANMVRCDGPCPDERREEVEESVTALLEAMIVIVEGLREKILTNSEAFIEETKEKLIQDVRIYTLSTAFAFLLIATILLFPAKRVEGLLLSAGLMFLVSLFGAWSYVFAQDWLFTFIFHDFIGWGYAVYLGLPFAAILDVVWNKGRITLLIFDPLLFLIQAIFPSERDK